MEIIIEFKSKLKKIWTIVKIYSTLNRLQQEEVINNKTKKIKKWTPDNAESIKVA